MKLTPSGLMARGFPLGDVLHEEPGAVSRLVARDEDPLPVRKVRRGVDGDAGLRELLRLSGSGRQKRELAVFQLLDGERPVVRPARSRSRCPSPSADGRRAVELSQVDAHRLEVLLVEEEGSAVRGNVDGERPVEPGQVALGLLARSQANDLAPRGVHDAEDAAVARDVVDAAAGGEPDAPALPVEGVVASMPSPPARANLVPARRPGKSADGKRAVQPDLPVRVDDLQVAVVVALLRVVDEGDEAPVRRDADAADPAGGVVEDFPDRDTRRGRGCPRRA